MIGRTNAQSAGGGGEITADIDCSQVFEIDASKYTKQTASRYYQRFSIARSECLNKVVYAGAGQGVVSDMTVKCGAFLIKNDLNGMYIQPSNCKYIDVSSSDLISSGLKSLMQSVYNTLRSHGNAVYFGFDTEYVGHSSPLSSEGMTPSDSSTALYILDTPASGACIEGSCFMYPLYVPSTFTGTIKLRIISVEVHNEMT